MKLLNHENSEKNGLKGSNARSRGQIKEESIRLKALIDLLQLKIVTVVQ